MQPALHLIAEAVGLLLVAATLPLVLELFVLSIAAALPSKKQFPDQASPVTVIIPAHNEEQLIAQCVRSLAGAAHTFVVAHNCTDATADRALAAGATVLTLNDTVGGKGAALDFGFRHAIESGAGILLVIDADSIAALNLIPAVSAAFAAGAQAVQARYQVANPDGSRRTRLAALAFLGMNVLRPLGRHRLGLSCGIFGNGFALSASTLARVPYTPNSLVEDLEYHLHLIRAGIRVEFLNHAAVFGEMPETSSAAASQRARWEGGRILMRRLWIRPLALEVLRGRTRLPRTAARSSCPAPCHGGCSACLRSPDRPTHPPRLALRLRRLWHRNSCPLRPRRRLARPGPHRHPASLGLRPGIPGLQAYDDPRTRLAARRDAAWVRTQRNVDLPDDR